MPASGVRPSAGAMPEQRSRAASQPARHGVVAECHVVDDKLFQVALATEAIRHANLELVIRLSTNASGRALAANWARVYVGTYI